MRSHLKTDIGLQRKTNQDEVRIIKNPSSLLAILCDGMGGVNGGQIAAQKCIEVFEEEFKKYKKTGLESAKEWLYKTAIVANDQILLMASKDKNLNGMGTTLSVLLINPDFHLLLSIGDSRIYSFDNNKITQLSEDQTYVSALLRAGFINDKEAQNHPRRNMLLSAVGSSNPKDLDIQIVDTTFNKNYFICSDGVYNMISIEEIHEILLEKKRIDYRANKIVTLANKNGGVDNISLIILEDI